MLILAGDGHFSSCSPHVSGEPEPRPRLTLALPTARTAVSNHGEAVSQAKYLVSTCTPRKEFEAS